MSGFDAQAEAYDMAAHVQARVVLRLAARLPDKAARILEIGCGTGLLSAQLAARFPRAELVVTDIAPRMLGQARRRLGAHATYRVMDGQFPDAALGAFDLIVSSLALQWFDDLAGALARQGEMLRPGGVLAFTTLGSESFAAWRAAHQEMGLDCGLRDYVSAEKFPWPAGFSGTLATECFEEEHADGRGFIRSLKTLGAAQARPAHRPVGAGRFRKLLARFEGGFTARYEVLFGEMRRAAAPRGPDDQA